MPYNISKCPKMLRPEFRFLMRVAARPDPGLQWYIKVPGPPTPRARRWRSGGVETEIETVGTDGKSGARRSSEKYAPPSGAGLEAKREFIEGEHPLVGL